MGTTAHMTTLRQTLVSVACRAWVRVCWNHDKCKGPLSVAEQDPVSFKKDDLGCSAQSCSLPAQKRRGLRDEHQVFSIA